MLGIIRRNFLVQFSIILYIGLSLWWFTMYGRGLTEGVENDIYTLSYPVLSLLGGIIGLLAARKWGGVRSLFGRSVTFFSLGLLAQFFGQAMYAYGIYVQGIEVPYPSIGDIGYFSSIFFYLAAAVLIGRVVAMRITLANAAGKLQALFLPLLLLAGSYWFFLRGYEIDWSSPLTVLLDFGYPLGQALYLSVALLVLLLSKDTLGGVMKRPLQLLLVALVVQYFCDFMFLYQASRETWYVGGVNDFLYSTSYFLMTLALTYVAAVFERIRTG